MTKVDNDGTLSEQQIVAFDWRGEEMTSIIAECNEGAELPRMTFQITPIRLDRLGEMYADGLIDDAQYRSGRKWQACNTQAEACLSSGEINALPKDLRRMNQAIGKIGTSLFRDVLVWGCSIEKAAAIRGARNKIALKGWQALFGEYLTELAAAY